MPTMGRDRSCRQPSRTRCAIRSIANCLGGSSLVSSVLLRLQRLSGLGLGPWRFGNQAFMFWMTILVLTVWNGWFYSHRSSYVDDARDTLFASVVLQRRHWQLQGMPKGAHPGVWREHRTFLSFKCCCGFWVYIPDEATYYRAGIGLLGSLVRFRQGIPLVVLLGFDDSFLKHRMSPPTLNEDGRTLERDLYIIKVSRAATLRELQVVVRRKLHTAACASVPRRLLRLEPQAMLLEPVSELFHRPDWLRFLSGEMWNDTVEQAALPPLRYRVMLSEHRRARRMSVDQSQLFGWYRSDWRLVIFEKCWEPGNIWQVLRDAAPECIGFTDPSMAETSRLADMDLPLYYDWMRHAERWTRRFHENVPISSTAEMDYRNRFCHQAHHFYHQRGVGQLPENGEKFTVMVNAFSAKRAKAGLLQAIVARYSNLSSVAKVLVLTYDSETRQLAEAVRANSGLAPVEVLFHAGRGASSLNHRFLPLTNLVDTAAVLHTDDDMLPTIGEPIEHAFRVWKRLHDQHGERVNLVGFVPRYTDPSARFYTLSQPYALRTETLRCTGCDHHPREYSIVLTKLAFVPHIYHFLYSCILPYAPLASPKAVDLLGLVDRGRNCEDLVMQGLASVVAGGRPPLALRLQHPSDLLDYGALDDEDALASRLSAAIRLHSPSNPLDDGDLEDEDAGAPDMNVSSILPGSKEWSRTGLVTGFAAHLLQRSRCVAAIQRTFGSGSDSSTVLSYQQAVAAPFQGPENTVRMSMDSKCTV